MYICRFATSLRSNIVSAHLPPHPVSLFFVLCRHTQGIARSSSLLSGQPISAARMSGQQQVRRLNVHEYVSMQIMAEHDIDIPVSKMAETPEEAEKACADIMGGDGESPRRVVRYIGGCIRAPSFFFVRLVHRPPHALMVTLSVQEGSVCNDTMSCFNIFSVQLQQAKRRANQREQKPMLYTGDKSVSSPRGDNSRTSPDT